jgi:hypothetical protein
LHQEHERELQTVSVARSIELAVEAGLKYRNCSYQSPLAADMPEVQQGDNSRQLKWHQAHKNFHDRYPDYEPPKHRLGLLITTKS